MTLIDYDVIKTRSGLPVGCTVDRRSVACSGTNILFLSPLPLPPSSILSRRTKRTWKFEYTGDPEPNVESVWGDESSPNAVGSEGYKKMMGLDVLNAAAFSAQPGDDTINPVTIGKNPFSAPIHTIPANASPDEIIAVVKGSMYRVSEWLLQVEAADLRRREVLDSDLYDAPRGDFGVPDYGPVDDYEGGYGGGWDERDDGGEGGDGDDDIEDHPLPTYASEYSGDDNRGSSRGNRGNGSGKDGGGRRGNQGTERNDGEEEGGRGDRGDRDDRGDREEGKGPEQSNDGDDDDDDDEESGMAPPPPTYHDDYDPHIPPYHSSNTNDTNNTNNINTYNSNPYKSKQIIPDRMTVIFRAFVRAQNNKARWLGSNNKLTRIKFHGGMERVLRLRMNWQQFDAMWNQLDSARSGDLDIEEFRVRFGDLEDFANLEGTYIRTSSCSN